MRARYATDPPLVQVSFRLPQSLLDRIDEHARRLSTAGSGLRYTRTDALKLLVGKGLTDAGLPEKYRAR